MRSKIVLLSICAFMSGCGLGNRGWHADAESGKKAVQFSNPFVFDLDGSKPTLIQSFSGQNYSVIGESLDSRFPAAFVNLPQESEIGTLDLMYVDENYQPQYKDEPVSTVQSRVERSSIKVYALKTKKGSISFGIKWESVKELSPKEDPIEVSHHFGPYCSRARIYINQLKDRIAIPDQEVNCNPARVCDAVLRTEIVKNIDHPLRFELDKPAAAWKCLDTRETYLKSSRLMNSSRVVKGRIHLLEGLFAGQEQFEN